MVWPTTLALNSNGGGKAQELNKCFTLSMNIPQKTKKSQFNFIWQVGKIWNRMVHTSWKVQTSKSKFNRKRYCFHKVTIASYNTWTHANFFYFKLQFLLQDIKAFGQVLSRPIVQPIIHGFFNTKLLNC
jgi:hypothetical protein